MGETHRIPRECFSPGSSRPLRASSPAHRPPAPDTWHTARPPAAAARPEMARCGRSASNPPEACFRAETAGPVGGITPPSGSIRTASAAARGPRRTCWAKVREGSNFSGGYQVKLNCPWPDCSIQRAAASNSLAEMAQLDGSSSRQAMAKKRTSRTSRSSSNCRVRSIVFHVDGTKTIWAANGVKFASVHRPQRAAIVAGPGQGVVDLADCREERDFDLADPRGGQIGEECSACQFACPATDADVHAELHGLTRSLHEVGGFRLVAGDEMEVLHAPSGQPREDWPQLLGGRPAARRPLAAAAGVARPARDARTGFAGTA